MDKVVLSMMCVYLIRYVSFPVLKNILIAPSMREVKEKRESLNAYNSALIIFEDGSLVALWTKKMKDYSQ